MPNICLMSLVGGLGYPITCTCSMVAWTAGSYFYLLGYSDSALDVKMARYKKGGGIKYIGILWSMGCTVSLAGSMLGWW